MNFIHHMASEIREKLEWSEGYFVTLMGKRVNMNDPDEVIVAAYEMGRMNEIRKYKAQQEFMEKLP